MSINRVQSEGIQLNPGAGRQGVSQKAAPSDAPSQQNSADSKIGDMAFAGSVRRAQLGTQLAQNSQRSTGAAHNPLNFVLNPLRGKASAEDKKSFSAGGAYYNKQMAVKAGDYQGIRQRITLPTMTNDPTRYYLSRQGANAGDNSFLSRINHWKSTPMDKPSFYQGGKTRGGEMDVGLTYERVKGTGGKLTFTTNPLGSDMRSARDRYTIEKSTDGLNYIIKNEGTGKSITESAAKVEAQLRAQLQDADGKYTNKAPVISVTGADGKQIELRPNYAFVPTERRYYPGIDKKLTPEQVKSGQKPENPYFHGDKYYYPNETVNMSVTRADEKDHGKLTIRLDGGGSDTDYNTDPKTAHTFKMPGLSGDWQPKTVVAIDQFTVDTNGNRIGCEYNGQSPNQHAHKWLNKDKNIRSGEYAEGVKPTSARLDNAVVHESQLIENRGGRTINSSIAGNKFYDVRGYELRSRNFDGIFQVGNADRHTGGRTINIVPSNRQSP